VLACGDLFHSTNFDTLCTVDASAPGCEGALTDAGTSEAGETGSSDFDFCTLAPADAKSRAAHACAWLTACEGPYDHNAVGPCMFDALQAFDCTIRPNMNVRGAIHDYWRCLSNAMSCTDVDACVYPGGIGSCPEAGAFNSCEGNGVTRVDCSATQSAGRPAYGANCASQGRACVHPKSDGPVAYCGGAGVDAGCVTGCKGTAVVSCGEIAASPALTIDTGRDCKDIGAGSCQTVPGPLGVCMPTQAATNECATQGSNVVCTGNDVSDCRSGRQDLVHCAALGGTCTLNAGVPPGTPWDPAYACAGTCGAAETCSNGKIVGCGNGISFSVDCTAQGLSGCTTLDDVPSGPSYLPAAPIRARCKP
jgi:hypothetical protein